MAARYSVSAVRIILKRPKVWKLNNSIKSDCWPCTARSPPKGAAQFAHSENELVCFLRRVKCIPFCAENIEKVSAPARRVCVSVYERASRKAEKGEKSARAVKKPRYGFRAAPISCTAAYFIYLFISTQPFEIVYTYIYI